MNEASRTGIQQDATLVPYERGVPWGLAACYAAFVVLMAWRIL